jgi:laminin G domain protein
MSSNCATCGRAKFYCVCGSPWGGIAGRTAWLYEIIAVLAVLWTTGCGGAFGVDPPDGAADAAPDVILGDHGDSGDAGAHPDAADAGCCCNPPGTHPEPVCGAACKCVEQDGTCCLDTADSGTDSGADGSSDAAQDAPACTCVDDLSNVGNGDFAIAFTIATTMQPVQPGYGALLNQRATCDATKPGWDVWLNHDGTVTVQVYDGSNIFDNVSTTAIVNDGTQHRVIIDRRASGTKFDISIDGTVEHFSNASVEWLTGVLANLDTGIEPVCSGNMAEPSEPLTGLINKVCIAVACVPQ